MSDTLEERSRKFHAFEWLRSEALKGNRHAETILPDLAYAREWRECAHKLAADLRSEIRGESAHYSESGKACAAVDLAKFDSLKLKYNL